MANKLMGNGPALLTAVLPSGDARVARVSASAEKYLRNANLFAAIDRITWKVISHSAQPRVLCSKAEPMEDHSLAVNAGITHWASICLPSYLLPGYPAVLHVFRTDSSDPITVERVCRLLDMTSANFPFAGPARMRVFVFNGAAEPIMGKQDWDALDPKLKLEIQARTRRLLDRTAQSDAPACDRVTHITSGGQMMSVRYNAFANHPAVENKPAVVVTLQPSVDQWLGIHAEDLPAEREFGRFLPALKFVAEQSGASPSLSSIARSVHLSQFHFHRKFAEWIGMTPKQFLLECQLSKAQALLSEGVLELSKVAELCGFAHQSHFTSRFKQTTGLTPTRWRRLIGRPGA